ncbi:probable prolyl 4-hydroxylase 9 [Impatiens glandulifera]|uniref:probable prolyl 4-hydroxylase 9 n=1 Tax=Impatiens glandulifera TaxID=253017 RepID=UPI001FB14D6C|nr:probable prolyl 4-hydroxylase 9 [Impatiens glandulifera]
MRNIDPHMKYSRGKRLLFFKSKLGLPTIFLLCSLFFVAGLFGSTLLYRPNTPAVESEPKWQESVSDPRLVETVESSERRVVEAVEEEENDVSMSHGTSGEDKISPIAFQILSWEPRTVYFPNFASAEQCQSIIQIAQPKLKPSSLALRKGETAESTKGVRTSSGTFISSDEDETGTLEAVERKIARATMVPANHGEAFNILRYEIGQRYVSHYDAFNPSEYGPQKSQRLASFLLYLSDVEEGGETMFPFENGSNMDGNYDYEKCIGLKVKPRKGDGLLFYSLFPNGTIDRRSLHGSCAVVKGEKWVATKWIRNEEQFD